MNRPSNQVRWKLLMSTSPDLYKLSAKDRIIVVMGPTGAGKSTFINYATGQDDASVGHDIFSKTSEIRAVRTTHPEDQGPVIFVDTPGFNDTHRPDIEILSQIAGWFVHAYQQQVPISAIVHLHRISDNRMAGSTMKNLQMFASMCGQTMMPRVILGTTMWSGTKLDIGGLREQRLVETCWADMISHGCIVERFGDSYESAWKILGKLPTEQENILLSHELCDDKNGLNKMPPGVELTEELNRLISDKNAAAHRLDEQVHSQQNPTLLTELVSKRDEAEKNIGGVIAQLHQLKIPFGKRIKKFFIRNKTRKSKGDPGIL